MPNVLQSHGELPSHVQETETKVDINTVEKELYRTLPATAKELIASQWYQEPNDSYREQYLTNPNDPSMHSPDWHQWGVISHTVQVGLAMRDQTPVLLAEWFGEERVATKFGLTEEYIDGVSKWDLLRTSAVTHDYGKFTQRQFRGLNKDGSPDFKFTDHEAKSGEIVRAWHERFVRLGLTDLQIEYVARCSELHFELGKVRSAAKKSPSGYTVAFTASEAFDATARAVAVSQPDMAREMGIFFIADSLGKTDLHQAVHVQTDEALQATKSAIEAEVAQRRLNENLTKGALQLGVNIQVGRRYMELLVQDTTLM